MLELCRECSSCVFSNVPISGTFSVVFTVASGPGEIGPDDCASLYHTLLIFFNGVVGDLLDLGVCGPDLMIMSCQLAGLLIMITMRLSFSGFVTSTLVIFCWSTPHLILIKLSKVLVEELCPDRVHDPGHPGFQMAFLLLVLSCMVSIRWIASGLIPSCNHHINIFQERLGLPRNLPCLSRGNTNNNLS